MLVTWLVLDGLVTGTPSILDQQVGTAGFEPALTRIQTEDVDQATLRPVEEAVRGVGPYG